MGSNLNFYFSKMGARVKVLEGITRRPQFRFGRTEEPPKVTFDIERDKNGEIFVIRHAYGVNHDVVVLNAEPKEKHLLLLSRQIGEKGRAITKEKFLCGHDERHWFVAAIPEREPVSTVAGAKTALKPESVREREGALGISREDGFRRKNGAFRRQGEWFFIPALDLRVNPFLIHHNEPLSRGNGGKPHWAAECYRTGGETVHVSATYPTGLSEEDFRRLPERERNSGTFRMMKRDAATFVRGEIRHPDHATVVLDGWHNVLMNTENRSSAMRFLTFLD